MPKYIDADEFVKKKREWYCEQCQKRKGMKHGKLKFVYEIGGAPCRACDVDDVISDIEDFPAADVKSVRNGWWTDCGSLSCRCSECGCKNNRETRFCPNCGAKMDAEPPKEEDDED